MSIRLVSRLTALALLVGFATTGPAAQEAPADLVLHNGRVATVDADFTIAEAVAVRGHDVLAVGSNEEIAGLIGPGTRVVDLDGRLAIPGFIEGHGHFTSLGNAKMNLDFNGARDWNQIVSMVEEAARGAQPGEWIRGRGWHQEKWESTPQPSVDGVPLHDGLSEVTPDNPVLLTHASGHAAFANALALELAGIDASTPDPDGGAIVRDANGRPTGLLRETAQGLVGRVASSGEMSDADREARWRRMVELAGDEALAHGVTSFHDAGTSFAEVARFRDLAAAGDLPIRLYVMIRASNDDLEANLADFRIVPEDNDFLNVRSIKHSIDGALGSHGAWLLEPYEDLDSVGHETTPVAVVERTAELALEHGYQLNTHAIGDRANREVLDIYERAWAAAGVDGSDLRWRIEHSQHVHPDDIPRFGALGVIASMQGIHCTSDAPWVFRRLGDERAENGAYMWRTLLDTGAVVTNGTDVPVEPIDPIASYYATVTRRTASGEVFFGDQAMTREEALRSYTIWAAYSAFEEHLKGSLEPGKLADIAVLSQDILTVPDESIRDTRVDMTVLGGEVVYER